ncbi:MAG: ATP synthase F0 subunit B [Deltaproteobacteria bacterium]
MITIDITMLIEIFNILILIVIMNAVLYKPVRSILDQREKRLTDLEKDVQTFNKNAQLRLQEFDNKLNDARRRAKSSVEGIRGEAQGEANEKIAVIRKDAEAAKEERMAQIRTEFSTAQQQLSGQVDVFATDMAAKVLGRAL